MKGSELRRIMKVRRIRTTEAAHALGIHPQTIRNLWVKDEVPRLYLMALTTYVWALGMNPAIMEGGKVAVAPKAAGGKRQPPVRPSGFLPTTSRDIEVMQQGNDLWSKLK